MDGSMSSMANMTAMVFTTSATTPLYSAQWTPASTGAYAGTCIFLIVLSVISRLLYAYRARLERGWHDKAVSRRYVLVAGETAAEREKRSAESNGAREDATLTTRGMDEQVRVVRSARTLESMPWRISTDLPRAAIFTVQAGVGYLLMLAVMALNLGYFLSVLGGLFLGELLVGRYTVYDDGHH